MDNGGEMPSPEIVESSQSQIEVEITSEWAAIIGSRLAEMRYVELPSWPASI